MDAQVRNYVTQAQCDAEISYGHVIDTTLQDWTTMPLTLNSEFTDYPESADPNRQAPKWWLTSNLFGAEMVIGPDLQDYVSAPSSLMFKYTGSGGNQHLGGLTQGIALRNVLQTKGTYRLIFSYLSDDDSIIFMPFVRLVDAGGYIIGSKSFPTMEIGDSGDIWHIYDRMITFDSITEDAVALQLFIIFKRIKDGAFQLNIDDVDFHYGFDITSAPYRIPTFPSAVPPSLSTVFKRTTKGEGHVLVTRGGKIKHKGTIQFGNVPTAQLEKMKAAWAFEKGHRLNIESVLPHRANVTLPKELRFHWPGEEFDSTPSWSLEDKHHINVPLQEI